MNNSNSKMSAGKSVQDVTQIYKVTWIGLIVNVILSAVKFALGVLGSSQALVADAFHSLSDLGTDFAVLFGVKFWSKPADNDHPYGHGRIETFTTLIIGIALLGVAGGIGIKAVLNIQSPHVRQPEWIAFIGAMLSIIVKEALYRWTLLTGKRAKSKAVIANAWHHRSDALSSIPVAVVIAAAAFNKKFMFLDHIGALIISVFILRAGWKIVRDAISEIIDTGASEKYKEQIEKLVLSMESVKSTHKLRTRRISSGWYVDLHIQVDPGMTVQKGHEISELVKDGLMAGGVDIVDVVVHLEPYPK